MKPEPATVPPQPDNADASREPLARQLIERCLSPLAFLAIFAFYAVWVGDTFLDSDGRMLDVHQNVPILILGLAVLVTLAAGQFDLSIGSMATLTTFLTVGLSVRDELPFALVLAICLGVGVIGGLINGFLVVHVRVNAFIATLGTGGAFAGLASVYGDGSVVTPEPSGTQLPSWFSGGGSLGDYATKIPTWLVVVLLAVTAALVLRALYGRRDRIPGGTPALVGLLGLAALAIVGLPLATGMAEQLSWSILVLAAVAGLIWVTMNRTTLGRHLYAAGSNAEAARLAGVPVGRETVRAFVIGGLLAGFAGVMLAANQGTATPGAAAGYLLPAFAAAFLSTVVFSRGQFTVWGTIFGGIFLLWVSQGLMLGGVPFTWTEVVNGVVLVLAVSLATVLRGRR